MPRRIRSHCRRCTLALGLWRRNWYAFNEIILMGSLIILIWQIDRIRERILSVREVSARIVLDYHRAQRRESSGQSSVSVLAPVGLFAIEQ